MEKQIKTIGVLTSGGDAPGMNAAVRAVVRTGLHKGYRMIGIQRGYNGLLNGECFEMNLRSVSNIISAGGTILYTARCLEFKTKEGQDKGAEKCRELGIDALVVIGGDGSYRGARELAHRGIPMIGLPGTIDNDISCTDYTIGFDTALNTACECLNKIRETSDSHERASLITVMGRNCGDIAVHTALACGAEYVMVPEAPWSIEEIAERIKWGVLNGKRSTILIEAEGANKSLTSDLHALCETHQELADIKDDKLTSSKLARVLEVLSGHEVRATVLGYTQRGGTPSAMDRRLGSQFGARAVELLNENKGGRAVGIKDQKIVDVPFEEVHGTKRGVDEELLQLQQVLARY